MDEFFLCLFVYLEVFAVNELSFYLPLNRLAVTYHPYFTLTIALLQPYS